MKRFALWLALLPSLLCAQSVPNGTITQNQIWTPAQWDAAWQSKADAANGVLTFPTLTGANVNRVYDVKFYGAKCDGVTDDSAAFNAAVSAAGAAFQGGAVVGVGVCVIAYPVTITGSHVVLRSEHFGDGDHDIGSEDNGFTVKWIGASGATMVTIVAPVGASNQALYGNGVQGVTFDCNNSAAIGLSLQSTKGGTYNGAYFVECTTAGLDTVPVSLLGEASDVQGNTFIGIRSRILLSSGIGIRLRGVVGHNTSFDSFYGGQIVYKVGTGIQLQNTDNISFTGMQMVQAAGGTAYGVDLSGDSVASANSIFFYNLSPGAGGVNIEGTGTITYPVKNVQFLGYDLANSAPSPVLGTGVSGISIYKENGHISGSGMVSGTFGESDLSLTTAITNRLTNAPNASIYLYNSSQDGIDLDDGTGRWSIGQDLSHDLSIVRGAGTGIISLSGQVNVNSLYISPIAIASLPACTSGNAGWHEVVNNGVASPTYLGAVSTTGSSTDPVFCNGTNWVYD